MARPVRISVSVLMESDLAYVSQKSSENGPHYSLGGTCAPASIGFGMHFSWIGNSGSSIVTK